MNDLNEKLVKRWNKIYSYYQFTLIDGCGITIESNTNYKDLRAWQALEQELKDELNADERVKSFYFTTAYEVGIMEWRRDLCYITVSITYYDKH